MAAARQDRTPDGADNDQGRAADDRAERKLDKALKDSFPASDPAPVSRPTGDEDEPAAPIDRKAPLLDVELVKRLARELRRDPAVKTD